MNIVVPSYYPRFACLAGACRHSCCIGWEIDIDADSRARYRTVGGEMGVRLDAAIEDDADGAHFILDEGERCPFLNAAGLCDLYTALGEDALCEICTEHPRWRNTLCGREECGLGLACEAVGALLLDTAEPVTWLLWDEDGDEADAYDPWEDEIAAARDEVLALLQDRTRSMDARLGAPFDMAAWAETYRSLERLDAAWDGCLDALAQGTPRALTATEAIWMEQIAVYFVHRHYGNIARQYDCTTAERFARLSTAVIRTIYQATAAEDDRDGLIEVMRLYSSEVEYSEENTDAIAAFLDDMDY